MHKITLDTAQQLTGLSRRSLRRRLATAMLRQERSATLERGYVPLEALRGDIPVALVAEDDTAIVRADGGDPEAQNDLGLFFMGEGQYDRALPWLQKAAEQEYAEAMYWLGRCHVAGQGVEQDEDAGLEWIRRAAERGHGIARRQMAALGKAY
ncbi:tetratricopeptide repeat protein [Ectothiorhodospira mobilis]|uniref:tetratricopeptide repeat protein n=1 Tax=Ectothiorhodospira mobilis TaxID=195064 RepID=UPI00190419DF|nr:SEL1-like repeat protein [Ectothiorhodospira mobilis]